MEFQLSPPVSPSASAPSARASASGIGFSKAMEAIGRNPEASGAIFVPYILGLALTEAMAIYAARHRLSS